MTQGADVVLGQEYTVADFERAGAPPAVSVAVDGDGLVALDLESAVLGVEFFAQGPYLPLKMFDLCGLCALSPLSFLRPAGLKTLLVGPHEGLFVVGGVEVAGETWAGELRTAGITGLGGRPQGR
ncbi:hypothetical protein [Streptomyces sp. NBRC 109706]|uniref:hypothetical protein n=1 Tax=Streptomyces sp. NBRC 109706 TaxID=1550035 RepID=UPI00131C59E2|nr:hypothetical protein [Streptomyces sp. NBRC 109706]